MTQPRTARLTDLFVDSSGFFAAGNEADPNHGEALAILRRAARERTRLTTTTYTVAETHALFLRRTGRRSGIRFLRSLEGGSVKIILPTPEDEAFARAISYRYTDKTFSLTDAISFAIMDRLGITTPFTFDGGFRQYGFTPATA